MKFHILLSSLIFLLVLVATAICIFYQTPDSPIDYITVRGEQVEFQGSGLYRDDPAWFALEGVVWGDQSSQWFAALWASHFSTSQRS